MGKHTHSIDKKILARIKAAPRGTVFSAFDFGDLGLRDAVDQALSRNSRQHAIRKVARGLYDMPKQDKMLGALSPQLDAVAKAVARRDALKLQKAGGAAAHDLGLTDQVPMRVVYLADGRSRVIKVGKGTVIIRKTVPRNVATANRISGTVIQALRWLGKDRVTADTIANLQKRLSIADRKQLLKDAHYAPAWIQAAMRQIAKVQD